MEHGYREGDNCCRFCNLLQYTVKKKKKKVILTCVLKFTLDKRRIFLDKTKDKDDSELNIFYTFFHFIPRVLYKTKILWLKNVNSEKEKVTQEKLYR